MYPWTFEHRGVLTFHVPEGWQRPRGRSVQILRLAIQLAMRAALHTYNRLEVVGRQNLPLDTSFVMVCNHSSHLDAVCLLASLPVTRINSAYPVAAADYFFSTPLRSFLSTIVVNGLPLDRHKGNDGLQVCRQLLAQANTVLVIFPEGTRTCSGTFGRFRSGVARLVAGTEIPVVPCYLSGAFERWPKGQVLPRPGALRLLIGRPRQFGDVSVQDRAAMTAICSRLRDDIVALREQNST
jgi:1-acyl-sn-glycerol-3-phosphate acyltransferase